MLTEVKEVKHNMVHSRKADRSVDEIYEEKYCCLWHLREFTEL